MARYSEAEQNNMNMQRDMIRQVLQVGDKYSMDKVDDVTFWSLMNTASQWNSTREDFAKLYDYCDQMEENLLTKQRT